jgi:hypothetical protein
MADENIGNIHRPPGRRKYWTRYGIFVGHLPDKNTGILFKKTAARLQSCLKKQLHVYNVVMVALFPHVVVRLSSAYLSP